MTFQLAATIQLLERTPLVLDAWLRGMATEWTQSNEGPGTWSAFDIVGHLIHGEKTDWIPRCQGILAGGESAAFEPFDRTGHEADCMGKTLEELLTLFSDHRCHSLQELSQMELGPEQFCMQGQHPDFGTVRLDQLLAAWAAHDLSHMAQIARAMAQNHRDAVGPWREFMPIVGPRA